MSANSEKPTENIQEDPYKAAAERTSQKINLYIDPGKFLDKSNLKSAAGMSPDQSKAWAMRQLAQQIDEQIPGISAQFTQDDLEKLFTKSLFTGPFADNKTLADQGICIINEPHDHQFDRKNMLESMLQNQFDPHHLKPLPEFTDEWLRVVGAHEGEHCNHDLDDPKIINPITDSEIRADRAAYEVLSAEGRHDLVQTLADMRTINAAGVDKMHATSFFLEGKNFNGITNEQNLALYTFGGEMNRAVSNKLSIPMIEVIQLRTSDPRKYANIVDEALRAGEIPALRPMDNKQMEERVAQELGISINEFKKNPPSNLADVYAVYRELENKGELRTRGDNSNNPHLKEYVAEYVQAVDRIFVTNTTPKNPPEKIQLTIPAALTKEPKITNTDDVLRSAAHSDAIPAADRAIAQLLGISENHAKAMRKENPDLYIQTAERALQNGKIELKSEIFKSDSDIKRAIATELKISEEEASKLPRFLQDATGKKLYNEDKMTDNVENPYIWSHINQFINDYKSGKAPEPEKQLPHGLFDKYDHLRSAQPDTNNGVPKIDLRSGDNAQMRIGELAPREYFALQADPVLAKEQITLKQEQEQRHEQKITPTARPASIAPA